MAAMTGKQETDGLSDYNRDVVEASLRKIEPTETNKPERAVAWMIGFGLATAALVAAVIACGPALWALIGGAL